VKLERAIEILEKEEEDTFMGSEKEWKAAVKLGIEALKIIKGSRGVCSVIIAPPLPGETW